MAPSVAEMDEKRLGGYTYVDATTNGGQLLEVCVPADIGIHSEDREKVKDFLAQNVISIWPRETRPIKTHLQHGGYGACSRYQIKQHEYAGGNDECGGGYMEVLEIKNPPDGRCGFVIYVHAYGADCLTECFYEFTNLDSAKLAWKNKSEEIWRGKNFKKFPGFIRRVDTAPYDPWFYAVANQHVLGDIVFPEVISEDPIFRWGHKFVVADKDGFPFIKICRGTILMQGTRSTGMYNHRECCYTRVYWEDGSYTDLGEADEIPEGVRPLETDELWIDEATRQFRDILSGKVREGRVAFTDGSVVEIKFKPTDPRAKTKPGVYFVKLICTDNTPAEGKFEFSPTVEFPNVLAFLKKKIEKMGGSDIQQIIELRRIEDHSGPTKKWAGVFKPSAKKSAL